MRAIPEFELIDTRLTKLTTCELLGRLREGPWGRYIVGRGTDAESALDTLLHVLQENDYDVAGLEGRIKDEWNPTTEEGDGETYYHLYLGIDRKAA